MFLSKILKIFSIFILITVCSTLGSFSQTNRKFAILQLVEKSVFSVNSVLVFNSPYRYYEQLLIDTNSRIKLLDGTYSNVTEENVRSHLEYKISSTKKNGQYFIIDTMEQFFAYKYSMLNNLGFGKLQSVDSDIRIADISGRKFKISDVFHSLYFDKNHIFPSFMVPTLGKYLMFSVYSSRDSSLVMESFETIQDSLLYNNIGIITAIKGSRISFNNQDIYITEYSILVDEKGKKLQLQDFESSSKIEIDYFYHEYSKKYIALKVVKLK